jgi:putative FmdB family regulatory protein
VPFYDYVCEKCGHEMEVMHSVHGHGPSVCPVCGGEMKKAITAPAVHFKGSGWARKERTGKAAKPARGESSEPSKPDTSTTTGDTTKASD